MKSVIMTLAAAFAVSAYANDHKPAAPAAHAAPTATTPAAPTAPAAAPTPGKPTATAPTTTHGDDVCKNAPNHKKCMEDQAKKKSM